MGKKTLKRGPIVRVLSSLTLVFLLVVGMMSVSIQAAEENGSKQTASTISYVALGDSIATGSVNKWTSIESYITYFYEYLQSKYPETKVILGNLAHDGDKASDLLDKLDNDETTIKAVKDADVITISIGGNNLMKASSIPGFNRIDTTLAEKGVVDFNRDWPLIIARIKELNTKDAKIIVNTVYNPYNQDDSLSSAYKNDQGLYNLINSYLVKPISDPSSNFEKGINDVISENVNLGYKIADVYTEFSSYSKGKMGEITYLYPPSLIYILRNPHPKFEGQEIITKLCESAYEQN